MVEDSGSDPGHVWVRVPRGSLVTTKGNTVYTLKDEKGSTLLMKDGTPFQYSSLDLALLGKKFLEADRRMVLRLS